MLVSTKGRYALRVMIDLAEHQSNGFVPLSEIAERQNISGKYLQSILKALVQEHYLVGVRGKGGGYKLGIPPEQVTVGSIIRLTEGTLSPVPCTEECPSPCDRLTECPTLPMWQRFDKMVNEFFDGITLADLMKESTAAAASLLPQLRRESEEEHKEMEE